jgi:hypothetical protein
MSELTVELVRLGLAFMLWAVAVWVGGSFVAAWVAWEKGREPVSWFILAFFFSPLVGLIALSAVPARDHFAAERPFLVDPAVAAARFVNGVHERKVGA